MGRVLVVEDDAVVRDTVATLLRDDGYDVEEASDGADALRRLATEAADPPSVIILDLMMHPMNGFDFVEELRRRGMTNIPIVVHSAYVNAGPRMPEVKAYIAKPSGLHELLDAVARYCAKSVR